MTLRIIGIGGTTRDSSSTELALAASLKAAQQAGASVELFGGSAIDLPMYAPERPERTENARQLVEALRAADGVLIASPGYHGTVSGLVKNALDYIEDMSGDDPPYLDGLPVGTISCAYGWQAAVNTVSSLRSIVHAVRGWPTPMSATINTSSAIFDKYGRVTDPKARLQLELVGTQVVDFARSRQSRDSTPTELQFAVGQAGAFNALDDWY